jgi:hypothetical protein
MNLPLRRFVVLVLLLLCVAVLVWVPWKGPEWGGAVLFAIAVAASAAYRVALVRRGLRRRRREIDGLCLSCGYDLRATPGRCPECGTFRAPA